MPIFLQLISHLQFPLNFRVELCCATSFQFLTNFSPILRVNKAASISGCTTATLSPQCSPLQRESAKLPKTFPVCEDFSRQFFHSAKTPLSSLYLEMILAAKRNTNHNRDLVSDAEGRSRVFSQKNVKSASLSF